MKAWQIFTHSVRQVFGNLTDALRISGLLYIVQMMIVVAMGVTSGDVMQINPAKVLLVVAVALVFSLWIAVAWHRFVLRGEGGTSLLPPFHGPEALRYLGRSLLIGLVIAAVAAVLGMAIMPLGLMLAGPLLGAMISSLLLMVPVFMVMLRLSIPLPAIAMGQNIGFSEGWKATYGETGVFFGLALLLAVFSILLGVPEALFRPDSIPALLWTLTSGWVQMMVGVSILTTLYGHYIEKRPLV